MQWQGNPQNGRIAIPCEWCGTHFLAWPSESTRKYCSRAHADLAKVAARPALVCQHCGTLFTFKGSPTHLRRPGAGRYCSPRCSAQAQWADRKKRERAVAGKYREWDRKHGGGPYEVLKANGYVYVPDPTGARTKSRARRLVKRSRLVLAAKLRRALLPREVVHHLNGVKSDDRPENLALYRDNAAHMRDHHQAGLTRSTRQAPQEASTRSLPRRP